MSGTFVCVNTAEDHFSVSKNSTDIFTASTHLVDIVSSSSGQIPFLTKPVAFDFHFEATLYNGITGQFSKRALGELIYLYSVV